MDRNGTKICSHCKTEKSRSDFWALKQAKDGLQHSCKDCKRAWRGCEAKRPRLDITGQRFGSLVATRPSGSDWECRCDCGRTCIRGVTKLTKLALATGHSCGKCRNWRKIEVIAPDKEHRLHRLSLGDITGMKLGAMQVIKNTGAESKYGPMYECLCDACGMTRHVAYQHLAKKGGMSSCGCRQGKWIMDIPEELRNEASRLVRIFGGILGRCLNPKNKQYGDYGGRGVRVFDEWLKTKPKGKMFAIWILDNLGPRPTNKHQLDRIDNDGNYEPGNLRWASPKENMSNRRSPASLSELNNAIASLEIQTARADYYQQLSSRLLREMQA